MEIAASNFLTIAFAVVYYQFSFSKINLQHRSLMDAIKNVARFIVTYLFLAAVFYLISFYTVNDMDPGNLVFKLLLVFVVLFLILIVRVFRQPQKVAE